MLTKSRLILLLILMLVLGIGVEGRTPTPQQPQQPRGSKPTKPASEDAQKQDEPAPPTQLEEELKQAITKLADEVSLLSKEVRRLRQESERSTTTLQLLLNEERLARLEERVSAAIDDKNQLDAREQDILRRRANIPMELILRGVLRREEAEAALRADLQRQLDDVHAQQAAAQHHIADLQADATRLRTRIESIRKKLEDRDEQSQRR
jgi:HAMP domain-containing protein